MKKGMLLVVGVAAGVAASVLGLGAVHAYVAGGGDLSAMDAAARSAGWALVLYAVMIAGVLANHLYSVASADYQGGTPFAGVGPLLRSAAASPRLWMALAVSPFLFHGIHVAAGQVPEGGAALFFAFQNGFFWQAVFSGFQAKGGTAGAGAGDATSAAVAGG